MRRCAVCSADISHRHGLAKYCSDACVLEARRPAMLTCQECDVLFERPSRPGAPPRYCSEEHRAAVAARRSSSLHAARMKELRQQRGVRRCEECGTGIDHLKSYAKYCCQQCRYKAQGHDPRRPAMSHEERLERRRQRRAAARPTSLTLQCKSCTNSFEHPGTQQGRKPRECQPCRDLKRPKVRSEPLSCQGCALPVPIERGSLALYCSPECQVVTNNLAQMGRRKAARRTAKRQRQCAICRQPIEVEEHGLRKYCSRSCWYHANYTPKSRDHSCEWCGGSMHHRSATARFCGQTCYLKAQYNRKVGTALRSRPCAYCGELMPPSTAHRFFCSPYCSRRSYFEANPEKVRSAKRRSNHQRRAMLANAKRYRVTERDLVRLWDRFGKACAYCGEKSGPLHQEHVIPIARGGDDGIGNLAPACQDCNLAKGDRTVMEWRLGKKSPRYRIAST
ncbi:HNH endonuclease [Kitasatospora sp. NPDC088779]|uniref:HNH endonuclease n=1 Tax=Kitasatospora sp. NPDC088779 TaxID=3154964 RepID=UPI00343EEC1B